MAIEQLCQRLDYRFNDPALLHTALTHSSVGQYNNQRLEFLGDAVIGLVVGEYLYGAYPHLPEGELTQFRASLVCREMLAKVAQDVGIAAALSVSKDILRETLTSSDSVLADALEALIGALYLDAGFDICQQRLLRLIAPYATEDRLRQRDAKSRLQEILQGQQKSPPRYTITATSGKSHARRFTVSCKIEGIEGTFVGHGRRRRQAEQAAAEQALTFLTS